MKRDYIKAITSVIAVLAVAVGALGSERELRTLTTADGLSDLLVNTIYKDSTGFVWLGTEVGLDRFDGNQIVSYRFPDAGQESQRVNAITELGRHQIYVGNQQGLYALDCRSDKLVPVLEDRIKFPVRALTDDGVSSLYIGTRQGLFCYNVGNQRLTHTLLHQDALSGSNEVTGLWKNPKVPGLWISTFHGLHLMNLQTQKLRHYDLPDKSSVTMMTGDRNMLYIGTHGGGVIPFDIAREKFLDPIHFGNDIITSLSTDGRGNLYVSTDGEGVFRYLLQAKAVAEHLTTSGVSGTALKSNSVYALLADDLGLLWIGYYQSGADYTPHFNDFLEVYALPGLIDTRRYPVRAFAAGRGHKVIGTRDGLFFVDEAGRKVYHYASPVMKSNMIFSIVASGDLYYIGTYGGGMYELDVRSRKLRKHSGGIDSDDIFVIQPDGKGSLWVGTEDGLYRMDGGKASAHYTAANSQLPEGNVYEIFFDSTGRGWVCTENGMTILDGSTVKSGRFPNGFFNHLKIRDIMESRDRLYFAPDRGDVLQASLDLSDFGKVDFGSANPMKMATFMIEDTDGWIWFGSDKGLYRYDGGRHFHNFNNSDGLPNPVFTLCAPVKDENGDLWFGNAQGLVRLDYKKFEDTMRSMHRHLVISGVSANGENISSRLTGGNSGSPHAVILEEGENVLEVMLANFDYILPQYFSVEYKLEGFDAEWRKGNGDRPIQYSNLPGGNYRLLVRAAGDPTTERAVLEVEKKAGFNWRTFSILFIFAMVVGFSCYLLYLRSREESREASAARAAQAAEASAVAEEAPKEEEKRYRTTSLSDEECRRIVKILDRLMKEEKPYVNPELKSAELAAMAATTSHALSYVFNQYMKKSFYDYVNEYRVGEFKRLVDDGVAEKYTLTALSEKCGFSSRASFFRHFKNVAGVTPAEYIKGNEK